MPDSTAHDGVALRRAECELLIATHVAHALAEHGIPAEAKELAGNPSLRSRDLALLGLGSLDWMALATRLEDETGMEFPDSTLVNPELRCVAGWAETLLQQGGTRALEANDPSPDHIRPNGQAPYTARGRIGIELRTAHQTQRPSN